MCGIAGHLNTETKPDEELLQKLLAHLRTQLNHRGPDDSGLWTSPSGRARLVHTRLSILDLSHLGHQPMTSTDGRYTITFNGEIYNFRAIRAELEKGGAQFLSHSDTEVLLAAYQAYGAECVHRLRGMFAFCIWDEVEQTAFLARDHLGIKPLYYSLRGDGSLLFASELKALRTSGHVSSRLNGTALVAYFETGSVPEPMTLLHEVQSLGAGCWLKWSRGAIQSGCYWKPSFGQEVMDVSQAAVLVRNALLESVRRHFVSDVPVGIFLSGGMDSTALLALAREAGFSGIKTFSIGVDDNRLDESEVARKTAAYFGSDHHELKMSGDIAQQSFAEFLQCGDQPSIDGFNTFTVSRFARQSGMKVVLSGLGGDEIFGGYPTFESVPKLARFARSLNGVPGLARLAGGVLEGFRGSPRLMRLGTMLRRTPGTLAAYRAFRAVFARSVAMTLARRYLPDLPSDLPDTLASGMELPAHELDQVSLLELSHYMRNQLLKDSDTMSMAHGLELRVPFVDVELIEAVNRVAAPIRLRHGKTMLLDAVPEVPAFVSQARKRGFEFPFQKWLQSSWGNEFANVTKSLPVSDPTWYQRWCLFVFERWLANGA